MSAVANKTEQLHALMARMGARRESAQVQTGLSALDELAPNGGFRCGAVHELLWQSGPQGGGSMPMSLALLLAKSALQGGASAGVDDRTVHGNAGGVIAWSDPLRELYPPAVAAAGVDLRRLMLLRPGTPAEELQMLAECLRCPAVLATVGVVNKLTQIQARRLQLAAEAGGRLGILMRPAAASAVSPARAATARTGPVMDDSADGTQTPARSLAPSRARAQSPPDCYAAASRWLVRPERGDDFVQRWRIQLVHGHGGRVGESVLLEVNRATGTTTAVRLPETLADRSPAAKDTRASA